MVGKYFLDHNGAVFEPEFTVPTFILQHKIRTVENLNFPTEVHLFSIYLQRYK